MVATATAHFTGHPDDLLFFNEVTGAMRRVAKEYGLALRNITHATMPAKDMLDFKGRCWGNGDIELVMRCTVDGEWCDDPRSPDGVYSTAAHELAHLRHMNHSEQHQAFWAELLQALHNQQEDHRDKVLRRLVKMQAQRDSEAVIGNADAAEAFAGMINKLLIEHELNPSDIDYARTMDRDPVVEIRVDLTKYRIDKVRHRVAWQESLARTVAHAHLCTFLILPGSNTVIFVGTNSHATVAEYAYGILVRAAHDMSISARLKFNREQEKSGDPNWRQNIYGFRESWLAGFIGRISERFVEARKQAVAEAEARERAAGVVEVIPGKESTALIRLNGQLAKVQTYIDDKFKARRRSSRASSLSMSYGNHSAGRERGRAAADRMAIGRKGIAGGNTRGLIGGK